MVITAVHLVVFVEFLVTLCFVWWTSAPDNEFERVGDHAGWSTIFSGGTYASAACLGMLITVIALIFGRVVPHVIAAVLGAICALAGAYGLAQGLAIGFGHPHTAGFVGVVLVGVAAALCAANAVVIRARRHRIAEKGF